MFSDLLWNGRIKKNTLVFLCYAIPFLAQAAPPVFNKSLGNLKQHDYQKGVFNGTTTLGNFRVTVYSATIFRIQVSQDNLKPDFSYAVISGPVPTTVTLKDEPDRFVLTTDSAELVIRKLPVRFILKNKRGEVINEDDPAFGTSWLGEEVTTYKKLQDGERFIGLGEKTGNLDRRGQACTNWNTDYYAYPSTADAIYLTTPFYIGIHHQFVYGVFMDNSSKSNFNFGASNNRFSSFTAGEGEMNYYLLANSTVPGIIEAYTSLTGRMEMPPLWSLGLQQSRYSYYPDTEVLRVAKTFREKGIPSDVIYLDIHYMDKYKIFSWDKQRFPNPSKLAADLKSMGFHLAVILDPGIKVEKNYAPYDEGVRRDLFVKYPDSSRYTAEVWPGWCHFPDFTNPVVRQWWGDLFQSYVNTGVDGFWNDMNEPATWGQSTSNLIEFDFDGRKATHMTARNVYGLNMTRSTYEGTKKLMNGRRPFLLTRSGFSGIQRYSAVWTGDNVASDEHMLLGVRLMNSMGLAGIPVTGMDVGGFTGGASEKLFIRWLTIGAFSPFFRIHAKSDSREQDPWSYGEANEAIAKSYVSLRYKLMPYLYSVFHEASRNGTPVNRSLAIQYPFDNRVFDTRYQNEFMFGPSILVAPGESDKDFYKVFLPGNDWYDFYTDKRFGGNEEIIAEAAPGHLPLFVKGGSVIGTQSVVQNLSVMPSDTLVIHVYWGKNYTNHLYYEDDGNTYDYQKGDYYRRELVFNGSANSLQFRLAEGKRSSKFKKAKILFHGFSNDWSRLKVNGIATQTTYGSFDWLNNGMTVNGSQLVIDFQPMDISISW